MTSVRNHLRPRKDFHSTYATNTLLLSPQGWLRSSHAKQQTTPRQGIGMTKPKLSLLGPFSKLEHHQMWKLQRPWTIKTPHNIKGYKARFLKEHPNWRQEFEHWLVSEPENTEINREITVETQQGPEGATEERETLTESQNLSLELEASTPEASDHHQDTTIGVAGVFTDEKSTRETSEPEDTPISEVTSNTAVPSTPGRCYTVTVAYPSQIPLDCPRTAEKGSKGTRYQNTECTWNNTEITIDWMFICIFCAVHKPTESEIVDHIQKDHQQDIADLESGYFREILLQESQTPPSLETDTVEDEEVPPLPPPLPILDQLAEPPEPPPLPPELPPEENPPPPPAREPRDRGGTMTPRRPQENGKGCRRSTSQNSRDCRKTS